MNKAIALDDYITYDFSYKDLWAEDDTIILLVSNYIKKNYKDLGIPFSTKIYVISSSKYLNDGYGGGSISLIGCDTQKYIFRVEHEINEEAKTDKWWLDVYKLKKNKGVEFLSDLKEVKENDILPDSNQRDSEEIL